ncbi:hypothetical protein [Brevundimonas sp.]|uniref:hypothetical protein n=1 Tax=Brevundimonas sp. TaxID=1871086 RepID=UPI0025CDDFCE|nr:hypothetical protein [Brevundimonas sp.]
MPSLDTSLIAIAACGSVVAGGFGAIAGTQLRVPPVWEAFETPVIHALSDEGAFASAPAYPSWAPPPLYPEAERDPFAEFEAAWDAAFARMDAEARPASYSPPDDLPPAYVVRIETRDRDDAYRRSEPYDVRREEREVRYASRDALRDAYREAAPPPREVAYRRPEPPREYRMEPPRAPHPPQPTAPVRDPRQVREDIARAQGAQPRGAFY